MEHNATLQGSVPPLIALRGLQLTLMEGKQGLLPSSSQQATCKLPLLVSSQTQSTQRSTQKYSMVRNLVCQLTRSNYHELTLMQNFIHYLFRWAEKPYPLLVVKEHPSAE